MLGNARIDVTIPVVDLARAQKFYGETLGLAAIALPALEMSSEMALFQGGDSTQIALYRRDLPTTADHTVASFEVKDLETVVETLSARGVVFEQYDLPGLKTDERGIATIGPWKGVWLKDTEGNILGIVEMGNGWL